jgi:pyruvate/2-oxoglutarate dehydrogenase complex dihydrolipoamide acyltransferase (E2) component
MSRVAIATPDPEFTAVLARWYVADGSHVDAGDRLCEIETDLASTDVAAPSPGTLRHLKREGDVVRPSDEVARIE